MNNSRYQFSRGLTPTLTPTPPGACLEASLSQTQEGKGKSKEKSRVPSTLRTPDNVGMHLDIKNLSMHTI